MKIKKLLINLTAFGIMIFSIKNLKKNNKISNNKKENNNKIIKNKKIMINSNKFQLNNSSNKMKLLK